MADEIAASVSSQRGLKIKRPIQKGVLSREQIVGRLMDRVRQEYTPEEIHAEERVLKRLGLLEEDVDYEQAMMNLLMEQVAGFYDPFAKELFIADWLGAALQRPALAHEIVHALGDQHFDLRGYALPIKEEGDRQLARAALVEGDGTAAMIEFSLAEQTASLGVPTVTDIGQIPDAFFSATAGMLSGGAMPAFAQAPRYLRETLMFPYLEGLKFIVHMRRRNPWSYVDAIYKKPPQSTEQIIHPEKYLAREAPVVVREAPIAIVGTWKRVRGETMGELQTRLWLETKLDADTARRASAGWAGDRLIAYEPAGGGTLAWVQRSVWDSEADAQEYERAASRWFAGSTGQEAFGVERRRSGVVIFAGLPKETAPGVADALWGWKVGKR